MKFRVLGVGMILSSVISIAGHAGAQNVTDTAGPIPNASAPAVASASAPEPAPEPVKQLTPPPAPATPAPAPPAPRQPIILKGDDGPSGPRANDWQEYFGFGAQIGDYNPSGLTARAGGSAVAIQVTAGFLPVLLAHYRDGDTRDLKIKFLLPFEVTPQLVIHAITFRNEIRGNALLGYRYNSVLGHGATLGGQIEKRVSRHWLLEGMFGVSYYPRAEDRLLGDQVPKNDTFAFPSPQFDEGITIGALFYP